MIPKSSSSSKKVVDEEESSRKNNDNDGEDDNVGPTTTPFEEDDDDEEEEAVSGEEVVIFPKTGVYLSWIINEFIPNICGGQQNLQGLTTGDVCEQYTKQITLKTRSSFCDYLLQLQQKQKQKQKEDQDQDIDNDQHFHIHEATAVIAESTVFVSHTFSYKFLDVVETLKQHFFEKQKNDDDDAVLDDVVLWWDLFSINQHRTQNWTFDWLSTTFKDAIGQIGHVVVIMSPWNHPVPYTRGWCVFEAYCAAITNSKYEIALSQTDEDNFLNYMQRNSAATEIDKLFTSTIRAEKSICTVPKDRDNIFEVITNSIGFQHLDSILFEQYRTWVLGTTLNAIKKGEEGKGKSSFTSCCQQQQQQQQQSRKVKKNHQSSMLIYTYMMIAAELYSHQGRYHEAIQYYQKCFNQFRSVFGINNHRTIWAMNCLGNQYNMMFNYDAAEPLLVDCLKRRMKRRGGENHPTTLASMNNLANLYKNQGRYNEAEPLYKTCLQKRTIVLGRDHPKTLSTMNNLANLYFYQGRLHLAKPLYLESHKLRTETLEKDHPSTTESTVNLAKLYRKLGQYDLARPMVEESYNAIKSKFGLDHPKCVESASILASIHALQGDFKQAEPILVDCVQRGKTALGELHPYTLSTMYNLAEFYKLRGRGSDDADEDDLDSAIALHRECLDKRQNLLGKHHPDTLTSMDSLAELLKDGRNYDEAKILYTEGLESRRSLFGDDHIQSLSSISNLANLMVERGEAVSEGTFYFDGDGNNTNNASAESLLVSCLASQRDLLGDDHENTINTATRLANLYSKQGKLDESDRMKREISASSSSTSSLTSNEDENSSSTTSLKVDGWTVVKKAVVRKGKQKNKISSSLPSSQDHFYRHGGGGRGRQSSNTGRGRGRGRGRRNKYGDGDSSPVGATTPTRGYRGTTGQGRAHGRDICNTSGRGRSGRGH